MSLSRRLLGGLFGRPTEASARRVVFIFACQRSGTTAFLDFLMGAGPPLKAFPECDSALTDKTPPEGGLTVRLNALEDVERVLAGVPERIVVVKPLVESQRASELLERFQGSVGFWLFRHHKEVAASMLAKWGPPAGASHLWQVIDTSDPGNWRAQNVPAELREQLRELHSPDMRAEDAAALFWYARNALYFAQGLERDERVLLLDYDRMCNVRKYVDRALDRFAIPHPPAGPHFSPSFSGKGRTMVLDPRVEALCAHMLEKLERHAFA
jgi:hypothetical protein